ncbi:caspase, EACC1-associated type [Yinghuangia soli]|uniref:Caspase family protein n=1 Tax=Yinghuangia soli TaxID=2908204 RepID=A0AA41PY88_9ACTN|nr:caspase family protein [Yinghuangia soli]MCF2528040.1 caspase family protein [Yinghuangia soli]
MSARAALIVATTVYTDESLSRLRAPAQDADALERVLADPNIGGFEVSRSTDRNTQELKEDFEDFLSGRKPDDVLVVYLTCHGLRNARGNLFFATTNTRKDRLASTGLESSWLLHQLDDCRARQQIVILDCCFSGAFAHGAKGDTEVDVRGQLVGNSRGRAILTASRGTEYSFEGETLSEASPVGSVFTTGLVEGLRTGAADTDADGIISVRDAYQYAFEHVRKSGTEQTPQLWLYGSEGEIPLARNPSEMPLIPLEEDVRQALESRRPYLRIGAVLHLGSQLTVGTPAERSSTRRRLEEVAQHDAPLVAKVARGLLDGRPAAESVSESVSESTSTPVPWLPPTAVQPGKPVMPQPGPRLDEPRVLKRLRRESGHLRTVAISPSGRYLVEGGHDVPVVVHKLRNGEVARTMSIGYGSSTLSFDFEPTEGHQLVVADMAGVIQVWDAASGSTVTHIGHAAGPVHALACSRDVSFVAAAGQSSDIQLFGRQVGKLHALSRHTDTVLGLAFDRSGSLLASAGADGIVVLWDILTLEPIAAPLTEAEGAFHSVAFDPRGSGTIVAVGADARLHVRNWMTDEGLDLRTPHTTQILSAAFRPDGRMLATTDQDGLLVLWDTSGPEYVVDRMYTTHSPVPSVTFSHDGRQLATVTHDNTLRIWDVPGM